MHRRTLIGLLAALPPSLTLPAALAADTAGIRAYETGLVDALLAEGRTVFVSFSADWCSTCRAQERVIAQLRAGNPDYVAAMAFVRVDWDAHGRSALATRLAIPRRSTLVVLRGADELGRLVADTREAAIRELLDTGLAAAQG